MRKFQFISCFGRCLNFNKALYFSSGINQVQKALSAQENLLNILKKELEHEIMNNFQDKTIEKTLKELEFELIDDDNEKYMELRKETDEHVLLINFEARSPEKNSESESEEIEEKTQEKEHEEEELCFFTAYVLYKELKYQALIFECFSLDSEINIDYMSFSKDFNSYRKLPRYHKIKGKKMGKKFNRLSEATQKEFIKLLRNLGLSTDVAILIEHLSLVKEQLLYEKWLAELIEFLE